MLNKRTAAFVPGLLAVWLLTSTREASPSTGPASPVVSITGGSVQGAFEPSLPAGATFKALPFAQPPVKELRWREPQPVLAWKGIRNATRPSASCIQPALGTGRFLKPLAQLYGVAYNPAPVEISEDCLYLNVWTPEWPVKRSLPMMVWIHGGSNVIGSGGESGADRHLYDQRIKLRCAHVANCGDRHA
jgi:para-nitrobenzyl esterase